MGWFNPPLYKQGNKKCPYCGHDKGWALHREPLLPRLRALLPWSSWRCSNCQSKLDVDWRRHVVGWLVWGPLVIFTPSLEGLLLSPLIPLFFAGLLFLCPLAIWWFESVNLKEEIPPSF